MMHKAWCSIEEVPFRFPRSSIKFQGHKGKKIADFDPNWAFPEQGWGQIRFIKYKYKYIFFRSFKCKYKYKYISKNLIKYKYKYKYSSSNTNTNTQWGRDKIAAILQMTYWNLLYCKIVLLIQISLKIVSKGPIYNKPTLVQIMAWRWVGNKPLSDQWWPGLLMHKCITQSKWVNVKCLLLIVIWMWYNPSLEVTQWSLLKQKHVQDQWLISSCVQEISLTKGQHYLCHVLPE